MRGIAHAWPPAVFCPCRKALFSRPAARAKGAMDALAAAAAVAAITIDSNADEDVAQREARGTLDAGDEAMVDVETITEDKENTNVHAADSNPEDAPSQVSSAPKLPCHSPCAQHLTRSDRPVCAPRMHCVPRCQSACCCRRPTACSPRARAA